MNIEIFNKFCDGNPIFALRKDSQNNFLAEFDSSQAFLAFVFC